MLLSRFDAYCVVKCFLVHDFKRKEMYYNLQSYQCYKNYYFENCWFFWYWVIVNVMRCNRNLRYWSKSVLKIQVWGYGYDVLVHRVPVSNLKVFIRKFLLRFDAN